MVLKYIMTDLLSVCALFVEIHKCVTIDYLNHQSNSQNTGLPDRMKLYTTSSDVSDGLHFKVYIIIQMLSGKGKKKNQPCSFPASSYWVNTNNESVIHQLLIFFFSFVCV